MIVPAAISVARSPWDEPFVAAPAETGLWRDYHLATAERQDARQ
jgi:hypothetical protein